MLERGWLGAWCGFTVDKCQMDRAVGVGVSDRRAYAGIHDLKRDLLAAFAGKRLAGRFARLDLSANELPMPTQRLANRSTSKEILVPAMNYSADNFYDFLLHRHSSSIIYRLSS